MNRFYLLVLLVFSVELQAGPFAPAAGQSGSTAIAKDSAQWVAWATGWNDYLPGSDLDAGFKTPEKALGKALGDSYDVVSLGNGGSITLTFERPIMDGEGYDFAVFENSISDTFLELAWVEVSSNGSDFYRFDNYSYTPSQVSPFGVVNPTNIDGLAGKYKQGYGTPFDLSELKDIIGLDLNNIGYIRIKDILGNGSERDTLNNKIYDPYKTISSAGFDLDAIGVIHQAPLVQNSSPVVSAGSDQSVVEASRIQLQGSATDVDGSISSYQWQQISGPTVSLSANDIANPVFIAPSIDADSILQFRLVAIDDKGASSDADLVQIMICNREESGCKPVARAGEDRSAAIGESVSLDGSASLDPQNQALSYEWTQVSGPQVSLSNPQDPQPSFIMPTVAANTPLSFSLVVTDADGNVSHADTVNIIIKIVNHAPIAELPITMNIRAGATLVLDGSASYDPDHDSLNYFWEQTAGTAVSLSSQTAEKPSLIVPLNVFGETLAFKLTVSDGFLESNRELSVTVNANNPPSVSVEKDRLAAQNQAMVLHAIAQDPDGDSLHFKWEQIAGAAVEIEDAETPGLRFNTPAQVSGIEQLSFKLTVSDDFTAAPQSGSAEVHIMVTADGTLLDCSAAKPSRSTLWPATKGLKPIRIDGVSGPNPYAIRIDAVNQDEPVRNPTLKDKTGPDARIVKPKPTRKKPLVRQSVLLRAERQGINKKAQAFTGNGRIYSISFTADDGYQNCTGQIFVQVPPNKDGTAILDTATYDSIQR